MFKVPDWSNDVPKNDDVINLFGNKNKNKKIKNKTTFKTKNKVAQDVKTKKQKNNDKGIRKQKNKVSKTNNYVSLTKEDHINNRILKRNLRNTNAEARTDVETVKKNGEGELTPRNKHDTSGRMKKKELKRKKKSNSITKDETKTENNKNSLSQEEKLNNNSKSKNGQKRLLNGLIKNSEENGIDIQSINAEELHKLLVNAKRKKLNDKIKNDDVEDLLFGDKDGSDIKVNKSEKRKLSQRSIETESNDKVLSIKEQSIKKKKKEKIMKVLQNYSNRNVINTSGDKLRMRMLERLKAAQFRYLNEKLYTSSGSESQELFKSDPTAFQTYHEGYQLQVKKWPINPLDLIVKRIQKMPKSHVVADMGCGEAALSRRVAQRVHSFDLVAAPGVRACDMARVPLPAACVHVAVYCLALMGTDLTQYLLEANRVLKIGGHLLIAEVESRFDNPDTFSSDVQRLGFSLKKLDKTHKMFIFMEFNKVRDPPAKKAKLPVLSLKPCLYKRR